MRPNRHVLRDWVRVVLLAVLVSGLVTGCGSPYKTSKSRSKSPNKTGKLVGTQVSFALDDAQDGRIDNQDFGGVVYVELDDGTEVQAIWDKKLGTETIGGMELEIAPTEDPDYWEVVRIVSTPPAKIVSTPPAKAENTQGRQDIFVIQGVVLDAEGVPLSGKRLTLYRKTSSSPPPTKRRAGGVEAPWTDPEAPRFVYVEFEGEMKDGVKILNPSAKTDQNGRFRLEVKPGFLGDAENCTLTVALPVPTGGITDTPILHRGEDPLVFECPSSANSEIDLGELRVE